MYRLSIEPIKKLIHEFKYCSGVPQFFMYGIWVCILGSTNATSIHIPISSGLWLISGLIVLLTTFTQNRKMIKYAILFAVLLGTLVLNLTIFTVYTEISWINLFQTPILARSVLIIWGVYLANLCSRQLWAKGKVNG